jgi:GWxTD domain-containing protein
MLTLVDQTTDKQSTRVTNANVPDPETDNSVITSIRMLGKEVKQDKGWYPITTYDAPGKLDSLEFNYQILNRSDQKLVLNSKLIKFKTDTSYAKPMNRAFGNMPSLFDEGISYDNRKIIHSNRRVLTQNGDISIEFNFSDLPRGNYRFIVDAEEGDRELYKARDFSIKSSNYPTLKSAQELARPLIYLMDRKEYRDLMNIEDRDSLKSEVDRFWLRKLGNKSRARAVIELYYERVEEANKLFSNFKEGWKTDRGMVYILFGPPWYREKYHQEMNWSYTYDLSDPDLNFNFHQVKVQSEYFPFEHYVLDRKSTYYTILNRQKQLWLSGRILERKL